MKGKVKITKISEDDNLITGEVAGTPIANVKFEIYDDSGKLVDTLITKADGIAISKDCNPSFVFIHWIGSDVTV